MRALSACAVVFVEIGFVFECDFPRNVRYEIGGANIALMHERSEILRVPRRSPDEQATFPILSSFLPDVLIFFDMQRIDPSSALKNAALLASAMTGEIDIGCTR